MANNDTLQYRQFIERLQREENRPDALTDIKNMLAFKPAGEAVSTIRDQGLSKIIHCLNVSNKTHVDMTCEVLRVCFEKFTVGDVIKNYTGNMMYLLRHEKSCVRRLAIDEVHKAVSTDLTILPVTQYIDVFVATAQMVADEDIGVANKAVLVTSSLPHEAFPKVLDEMMIALEYGTSGKCNAFEVIVNISTKSHSLFQLSTTLGYVDCMISELETTDPLYLLNLLELLSRMVVKPYVISYLVNQGALQKMSELVEDLPNNPVRGLLMPGYLKFFGSVAHHYPKDIFNKYPAFLGAMFSAIESRDEALLPVALDTLAFIAQTIEGKLCLAAVGSRYTQTVQLVGEIIRNSRTDIKTRALHCFASLIAVESCPDAPKQGPIDHRVTLMTREWYRSLSTTPDAMQLLVQLCQNPFPEIKLCAFQLLDAVCQHQWGEELVHRTAGFVEFLLDRSLDHSKEVKEAKFDIIRRLSRSPAFDDVIRQRLVTYVEQGAFYSETALEVAMDDGGD